ncbi:UDP-glucose 4-epimerase [Alicyclobacillus contaminans]|nr:UDP-glucose 4-epimerase [Alicyclobacillus contaminans]
MKILVTGGSGFIGGATVAALLNRGHDVINVDLQPAVHGERHYSVDVTDAAAVDEVFAAERPQRVIHLAAHISVPVSVEQPRMDMVQNIGGSLNVLESSRKFGVERVLFASSAAVYGNGAVPPIDEQTETVPVSPYGISKRAVEMYLTGFYCQWFSYAILRYANVYGPRQTPEGGAVIARFVEGAARHHAVQVFGDGLQTRDFVHVEDVARVNALAIEHSNSVLLNVGSGVPVTVNDLVSTLQSFMSRPLEVKHLPRVRETFATVIIGQRKCAMCLGGHQPSR